MSNYYPVGSSQAARINFDESVQRYARETAYHLNAAQMRVAALSWETYFDVDQYETDDMSELRARFAAEWEYNMTRFAAAAEVNER